MNSKKQQSMSSLGYIREAGQEYVRLVNTIINGMLLTVVYVVGIGLTAVVAKLFGKHFLETKIDDVTVTYWNDFESAVSIKKSIYRQF